MAKQSYLELNAHEKDWLAKNLSAVKGITQSTLGKDDPDWLQPGKLDQAYAAWYATHDRETEDPNPLINAFGMAFGEYLVREHQLSWVIVQEKDRAELAVHGEIGEILLFPPHLVAKRYEKGLVDFLEPLSLEIGQSIQKIRSLQD